MKRHFLPRKQLSTSKLLTSCAALLFFPPLYHTDRDSPVLRHHTSFTLLLSLSLSLTFLTLLLLFISVPTPYTLSPFLSFSLFLSLSLSLFLYSHRWRNRVIETIMEQNLAEHAATLCSNLKRSDSELALAEFIRSPTTETRDTAHPFAEELDVIFGDGDLGFSFKHKVSLSLSLSLSLHIYICSSIRFRYILCFCARLLLR